jgi:hypothetical protein
MTSGPRLGWHFLRNDGTTGTGSLRPVPGETLQHEGPLSVCHSGLHYCPHALDALNYAPGSLVERVEPVGEVVMGTGLRSDKYVTSARRCLWIADATSTLYEFAYWCAERALRAAGHEPDRRLLEAITAKRAWARGEITDEQLAAAVRAAEVVSEDARDIVWTAAESVAMIAARAAAWIVAKGRLRDIYWVAASMSNSEVAQYWECHYAWCIEREAQRQRLDEMLLALAPASAR